MLGDGPMDCDPSIPTKWYLFIFLMAKDKILGGLSEMIVRIFMYL